MQKCYKIMFMNVLTTFENKFLLYTHTLSSVSLFLHTYLNLFQFIRPNFASIYNSNFLNMWHCTVLLINFPWQNPQTNLNAPLPGTISCQKLLRQSWNSMLTSFLLGIYLTWVFIYLVHIVTNPEFLCITFLLYIRNVVSLYSPNRWQLTQVPTACHCIEKNITWNVQI